MPKRSAGILLYRAQRTRAACALPLYRHRDSGIQVFLVHPGGPFWAKKDAGAWSIPKGEYAANEDPLAAARREFTEETGFSPEGTVLELGELKQPGGKIIAVWAVEGDCDPAQLRSNTFSMEWPPRSGRQLSFPEVDRGDWYSIDDARAKLLSGQRPFLDRLLDALCAK